MSGSISLAPSNGSPGAESSGTNTGARRLDRQKLAEIAQLEATDRHVRAHEQAHLEVAGPYATGGPSYTFAIGPDGQRYAVGGEVTLDASPDPAGPEATVQKAKIIEAAANAPVDPSVQDREVALQASMMEAQAEAQIAAQQRQGGSAYARGDGAEAAQIISIII